MYNNEDKELIFIYKWFNLQYPSYSDHFCHVANESKRSVMEWSKLKKMGFKKGFSDIFISVPVRRYSGLFIELKSKRANGKYGKPTKEQDDFINHKNEIGYFAKVCYGIDECIEVINKYFLLK